MNLTAPVHGHRCRPQRHFDPVTTGIAVLPLAVLIAGGLWLDRVPGLRRIPAPLIAMLLATGIQAYAHFPSVATIGSAFGGIPRSLPSFGLPAFSLGDMLQPVGPAFTIALLGASESLLTAVVADGMTGERHDSNQELIACTSRGLPRPTPRTARLRAT